MYYWYALVVCGLGASFYAKIPHCTRLSLVLIPIFPRRAWMGPLLREFCRRAECVLGQAKRDPELQRKVVERGCAKVVDTQADMYLGRTAGRQRRRQCPAQRNRRGKCSWKSRGRWVLRRTFGRRCTAKTNELRFEALTAPPGKVGLPLSADNKVALEAS